MTRTLPLLPLLAGALHAAPVLLDPPLRFSPPVEPGTPATLQYLGQPAKDGRIDLTATNGFSDRCFEAGDPGPGLPGDEQMYRDISFGQLQKAPMNIPWFKRIPELVPQPAEFTPPMRSLSAGNWRTRPRRSSPIASSFSTAPPTPRRWPRSRRAIA